LRHTLLTSGPSEMCGHIRPDHGIAGRAGLGQADRMIRTKARLCSENPIVNASRWPRAATPHGIGLGVPGGTVRVELCYRAGRTMSARIRYGLVYATP
jgi:hypothetical protein